MSEEAQTIYLDEAGFTGNNLLDPAQPMCQGRRHRVPPGRWNGVPPVRLEAATLEAGEGFRWVGWRRGRRRKLSVVRLVQGLGDGVLPAALQSAAVAVHVLDVDVVGETVHHLPPLGQAHGPDLSDKMSLIMVSRPPWAGADWTCTRLQLGKSITFGNMHPSSTPRTITDWRKGACRTEVSQSLAASG